MLTTMLQTVWVKLKTDKILPDVTLFSFFETRNKKYAFANHPTTHLLRDKNWLYFYIYFFHNMTN